MSPFLNSMFYVLENGVPKQATHAEFVAWANAHPERQQVAYTDVSDAVDVSTVFLCVDVSTAPDGPPICFETMVFGGKLDHERRRYATLAEAEVGHMEMVERVLAEQPELGTLKDVLELNDV